MTGKLDGKVAIITGAANGIGTAYARHLAKLGATAVVADIDESGAKAVAGDIEGGGAKAIAGYVDVSDADSAAQLVQRVHSECGSLDILVNNAAIYRGLEMAPTEEIEPSYWQRMFDVNVNGVFHMCRAAIPFMRVQRSGKIVNQASVAAYLGAPLALHYCTTKAAVIAMTKVLARELGEDNITCNAIAPGVIGTEATLESLPPMLREMFVSQATLQRMGETEDLLGVLELLATSASDYMTGQTLVVDGGIYTLG